MHNEEFVITIFTGDFGVSHKETAFKNKVVVYELSE